MNTDQTAMIEQAVGLTRDMLELADQGSWQDVIALEVERRQLLEQAFATREPLTEAGAGGVRLILDLDKRLLHASLEERAQVAGELSQSNRASRANHAYQAHSA